MQRIVLNELEKNTSKASLRRWYVLYTKPRYEKRTHYFMRGENIDCFLPMREEIHQWADRKKSVEVPLFTSYIFVYANEKERVAALQIDGAMKYVHFGGKIAIVKQETIDALRLALIRKNDIRLEETYLEMGKPVTVVRGPLQGLKGILLEQKGETRVGIQVEILKQLVSVEVPVGDLVLV